MNNLKNSIHFWLQTTNRLKNYHLLAERMITIKFRSQMNEIQPFIITKLHLDVKICVVDSF